jgi:predicted unusual protein kinase regulating ubiquinone biosynthesis (AarF/ABC1/UbiB family)
VFDEFDMSARQAASIGQVHRARKLGKDLAVKVQYPGVGASIRSDIAMVKPVALRIMGLREETLRPYLAEVEARLLEETDYKLELSRAQSIAAKCGHLPHLQFPGYYPALSAARILTMDWLPGQHLKEFMADAPSQEVRNQLGQALWDFYMYQLRELRQLHADPHPGNFLFSPTDGGTVGVLDFGCVKDVPALEQQQFLALLSPDTLGDPARLEALLTEAQVLRPGDPPALRAMYLRTLTQSLELVGRPFRQAEFNFGDPTYLKSLYALGDDLMQDEQLKQQREPRGSAHFVYLNRTYVGLFSLLTELGAVVRTSGA